MPYEFSNLTLPGGALATRVDGSGVITREDAEAYMPRVSPGGPSFRLPMLDAKAAAPLLPKSRRGTPQTPPPVPVGLTAER